MEYDATAIKLAHMYRDNFKKYLTEDSNFDFTAAGPEAKL